MVDNRPLQDLEMVTSILVGSLDACGSSTTDFVTLCARGTFQVVILEGAEVARRHMLSGC